MKIESSLGKVCRVGGQKAGIEKRPEGGIINDNKSLVWNYQN